MRRLRRDCRAVRTSGDLRLVGHVNNRETDFVNHAVPSFASTAQRKTETSNGQRNHSPQF
jgi:hypothetical protein